MKCPIQGCEREKRTPARALCDHCQRRKNDFGDPEAPPRGNAGGSTRMAFPTDDRRPGESVFEWCRRLDGYYNAPTGVAS